MASKRFEVTAVPELKQNVSADEIVEMVPLIHTIDETVSPPVAPPLPTTISTDSSTTKKKLFSRYLAAKTHDRHSDTRRRATTAAGSIDASENRLKRSSSADNIHNDESVSSLPSTISQINVETNNEPEEPDPYATVHSTIYDLNLWRSPNKFLQELRLKRRELREKSKNIPIEQRIASRRGAKPREILRAQDIFDVHFVVSDEDDVSWLQTNLYTEESQQQIRNDIYNELNRQRQRRFHKQTRQLFVGRSLLIFVTSLLALMGITLLYVVFDLYNRGNSIMAKIPDNKYVSMIYDQPTNYSRR